MLTIKVIFLIYVVTNFIGKFLEVNLSLLSAVLALMLISFLSPCISSTLVGRAPTRSMLRGGVIRTFVPRLSTSSLLGTGLDKAPLRGLAMSRVGSLDRSK